MPLTINGTGTITGLSVDGLPAGTVGSATLTDLGVATGDIAASAVTTAKLAQPFTSMTAVASTSGTSINFTGIPSWVKRITVMFSGVSTSGTSQILIQLGTSGGVATTGYSGAGGYYGSTNIAGSATTTVGIPIGAPPTAADIRYGALTIFNISGFSWVGSFSGGLSNIGYGVGSGGGVTLSGAVTTVRLTTANGTDTFDAGTINVMYE